MTKTRKTVSEGVKHARALEAAIEFYKAKLPEDVEEAKNWPFLSTIERVVGQLNNL